MTGVRVDPKSLAGKFRPPAKRYDVVVVGAGPAGSAAAVVAAAGGLSVMLVDENPVPASLMGLDVPHFFGGRMGAAVQNPSRMTEQIASANPGIAAAFEAGIEVRLGTCAWGAFVNGPAMMTLPEPVLGLADETRSWFVGFERLILATGSRDLVLFFEGAEGPGVMGARALETLLSTYDAFEGRRLVILGSNEDALRTAALALDRGLDVAALVEVMPEPQGPASLVADLVRRGVPVLASRVILRAERDALGVTGAILAPVEGGPEERLVCDTICLALGRVPVIELADVVGAAIGWRPDLGGHVPLSQDGVSTSLPGVFVAGDCAGIGTGTDGATAHGRQAAEAVLRSLGRSAPETPAALADGGRSDRVAYGFAWMKALIEAGDGAVMACQCEEVSRADLLGVQPPRYLGPRSDPMSRQTLDALLTDGPPNQDQIKRLTRACMGPCQARRCREQVAMMLAIAGGRPLAEVPLAGFRAPVRPLTLAAMGAGQEDREMLEQWDVWFGIPTQWVPYDEIGTEREAAWLGGDMHL